MGACGSRRTSKPSVMEKELTSLQERLYDLQPESYKVQCAPLVLHAIRGYTSC